MRFKSGQDFLSLPSKSVTVMGMSGVGKTTLAALLQKENWFQYSVDYRIGTKYMDEHIADNFKREAMHNPFLRDLLRSDSIYIRSNITFDNLSPLSTYLGKPGSEAKGGITFAEYKKRQGQHRVAEIQALHDVPAFIDRANDVYGYQNFICDSGGSLCEVVDPDNAEDPVLRALADNTLLLYIEGTPEHAKMLIDRFRKNPKPMYYQPAFLDQKWDEYKLLNGLQAEADVDPNGFAVWGFEQLIHHRIPLYRKIADNFGYTIPMSEVPKVANEDDFAKLIVRTIDKA
ncbi:ATPase [Aestuariivirga litoralis]|uniref:ATPase n=1 Tax=Aestuariivirga litoralis TaxID=2650924 RepID=UPI0018C68880|nr:ATPase [Aestuariivirga litoralis]MBG1233015.1 ATPase [Aestuariivirga litoralis]